MIDIPRIKGKYQIKGSVLKQMKKLINTTSQEIDHGNTGFISIMQWYDFSECIELKKAAAKKNGSSFTIITHDLSRMISSEDHKYKVVYKMGGLVKTLKKMGKVESDNTSFTSVRTVTNLPGEFVFEHEFPEVLTLWSLYHMAGTVEGILDLSGAQLQQYAIKERKDFLRSGETYTRSLIEVKYHI